MMPRFGRNSEIVSFSEFPGKTEESGPLALQHFVIAYYRQGIAPLLLETRKYFGAFHCPCTGSSLIIFFWVVLVLGVFCRFRRLEDASR